MGPLGAHTITNGFQMLGVTLNCSMAHCVTLRLRDSLGTPANHAANVLSWQSLRVVDGEHVYAGPLLKAKHGEARAHASGLLEDRRVV